MAANGPENIVCSPSSTTTISTIAVQSGNTRIVIALLQSKEWIQLKIQEMLPAMTDIGSNLDEATELYQQHEKVLDKLQTKQSPVEELLRQADSLISSQKPRGEVYSAMAENLGLAWKDLNAQLEQRRHILEQAVHFFLNAQQFSDQLEVVKRSVSETFLPNTVESASSILNRLKEERKAALSGSMRLLADTQVLLERLCEVSTHSMGDSRPLHMQPAARKTMAFVEQHAEALQDRWRQLDGLWSIRRTALEQCLQRCALDLQMEELEKWLRTRAATILADYSLGDSVANSEILLHEHHKTESECKERQEWNLRLVKQAEDLQRQGNYAGEELRSRAYLLLAETAELVSTLEQRRLLLADAVDFFSKAHTALTKLDQIEIQVSASESTTLGPTVEDVANPALQSGRQILSATGLTDPAAQGIARKVEELENRKRKLTELCKAKDSAAMQKTAAFRKFCEKYDELTKWLSNNAEFFVQRTRDMGTTQTAAKAFLDQHETLQHELRMKGMEMDAFLCGVPALEKSGGDEAAIVRDKAEDLKTQWGRLRNILDKRILIAQRYLAFLKMAAKISKEMDEYEAETKEAMETRNESKLRSTGDRQLSIKQEMLQLKNTGKNFLDDALKMEDLHLNTIQSTSTVEDILSRLELRMATLNSQWLAFHTDLKAVQQTIVQWEHVVRDSLKVQKNAQDLESKLFPIIPKELHKSDVILSFLERRTSDILPQLQNAHKEIDNTLMNLEKVKPKDGFQDQSSEIKKKLQESSQLLQKRVTDYQVLVSMMMTFFKNYEQLEKLVFMQEKQLKTESLPNDVSQLEALMHDHESNKNTINELLKFSNTEAQQLFSKIDESEPAFAAAQDKEKISFFYNSRKDSFEREWADYRIKLENHFQLRVFFRDMHLINQQIQDLNNQLASIRESYGECLPSAMRTSEAFQQFEKTIEMLQIRIQHFVSTAERLMRDHRSDTVQLNTEVSALQTKWSTFRTEVDAHRRLIDVALQYYKTIDESEEWLKEGSRLLISVARRSSSCNKEAGADALRQEIRFFLDSGRLPQEQRIRRISELSIQLYGQPAHPSSSAVTSKNKDMLESLSVITSELNTLSNNIKMAQQAKSAEAKGKEELNAALQSAQHEAEAARLAAAEALQAAKTLKAQTPPRFTRLLVDAEVPEGTKFTFECRVDGEPTPQVQWFKDGILVENNPDYQTSVDNGLCKLTIEETFSEDTARFTCRATNSAGVAETQSQLLIKESRVASELIAPHFVQELADSTVREGEPHQLECQVSGNPLPLVSWFKDEVCVDYSIDFSSTCNNGFCSLRIEEAGPGHRGRYTCRAINPAGQVACSANLEVQTTAPSERPWFVSPLSNVMARAGQKLRLECSVSGQPQPSISWLHNSKSIKETRDTKLQFDGSTATLVITEAFPKDAGIYTVIARNKAGEAVSTSNVSVKGRLPLETSDSEIASDIEPAKPQVKEHLVDQTVAEGKKVRMDCIIVGQPEPEVIWYHNGKPVKESDDFQLLFEGDRCTLLIEVAYLEDAGTYKCVAINSGGEASSSCQLNVNPASEVIQRSTTMQKDIILTMETHQPPKFLKLLDNVNVAENQEIDLECQVREESEITITWLKDGSVIHNSPDCQIKNEANGISKLTIPSAKVSDRGTYSVKAQNKSGESQSICSVFVSAIVPMNSWEMQLESPPTFLKHVQNLTLALGSVARFDAIVDGSPKPKVRWNFKGKPVPIDMNHEVGSDDDKDHWLVIRNVQNDDMGRYSAIAENNSGIATTSALLSAEDSSFEKEVSISEEHRTKSRVMSRKTVMQTSTISSMSDMSDAEFQAPEFPTFSSLQSQQLVKMEQTSSFRQLPPVEQKPVAPVAAVPVAQKPLVPPKFSKPVSTAVVTEGEKLLLEAEYEGEPEPVIQWSKNNVEMASGTKMQVTHGAGRTSLFIVKSQELDSGCYSCVATNSAGKATSMAEVKVKPYRDPPKFKKKLEACVVKSGSKMALEVEVTGVPRPEVHWHRNGRPLQDSPDFRISSKDNKHSLVIREVFPDDSGSYMVSAKNSAGEVRSIADLYVEEDKSPEEERKVTYQEFTSVQQTREMFTKISAPEPLVVAPHHIPFSVMKPVEIESNIVTQVKTPSPPPIPAVAARVWSQPKPTLFPAPAITETIEPILVEEPCELLPEQNILTEVTEYHSVPDGPVVTAGSESFVKKSITKFSHPVIEKPVKALSEIQPVHQNGFATELTSVGSYSASSQSSFSQTKTITSTGSYTSNVPKTNFVPKPVAAVPTEATLPQSRVPVWQPKKQEIQTQSVSISTDPITPDSKPTVPTENKFSSTDITTTSNTSCQTAFEPCSESTTKTSYSSQEISITKNYEMIVERSSTGTSSPKPIIKKDFQDEVKPKKEVVIEEVPVLGAEVRPPLFSKVRGANVIRKIYTDV